jgi:hypothetical protein
LSCWRAGQNIELIETPPWIHALVSRMKSWFGSGRSTKSVGCIARPTAETMSAGSSASVTPPVRRVASSSAASRSATPSAQLLPRAAHPDRLAEVQIVAVRWREALARQVRAVDDHAVQGSDLRGDASSVVVEVVATVSVSSVDSAQHGRDADEYPHDHGGGSRTVAMDAGSGCAPAHTMVRARFGA